MFSWLSKFLGFTEEPEEKIDTYYPAMKWIARAEAPMEKPDGSKIYVVYDLYVDPEDDDFREIKMYGDWAKTHSFYKTYLKAWETGDTPHSLIKKYLSVQDDHFWRDINVRPRDDDKPWMET